MNSRNFIHAGIATRLVNERLAENELSFQQYEEYFNRRVEVYSKTLVLILIPVFAFASSMLFWKPRYFYVQHFVFSIHLHAFLLIQSVLVLSILVVVAVLFKKAFGYHPFTGGLLDTIMTGSMAIILFIYIFIGLNRVFQRTVLLNFLKSVVLFVSLFFVLLIYKSILFFTVFYTS